MGKKSKIQNLDEMIFNAPSQDASIDYCIKGDIATSYTFNPDDPSMPYCKVNGDCKYKIDNYVLDENAPYKYNCLFMHEIYRKEIEE